MHIQIKHVRIFAKHGPPHTKRNKNNDLKSEADKKCTGAKNKCVGAREKFVGTDKKRCAGAKEHCAGAKQSV